MLGMIAIIQHVMFKPTLYQDWHQLQVCLGAIYFQSQLYFSDHSISLAFGTHPFHSVMELLLHSTKTYILVTTPYLQGSEPPIHYTP